MSSRAIARHDPPTMLFLLFLAYGVSGYVIWGLRKRPGARAAEARRSAAARADPPESS